MSGLFSLLDYSFPDANANTIIQTYSSGVIQQMNLMPALITPWQQSDIETNNVGGYFQNPVANVVNNMWSSANGSLVFAANLSSSVSGTVTTILNNTMSTLNTIATVDANNYIYLTNRLSNIVGMGSDTTTPHYTTAIGYGKMIAYLTNQTDGIQNTAPILGSFTSVLIGNTLNQLAATMNAYCALFNSTVTTQTMGIIPNQYTVHISSMSQNDAQNFQNAVANVESTLSGYYNQDILFYNNSVNIVNQYTILNQFNNMGQSETDLILNFIGTPKIISRLTTPTQLTS